ncbi:MAG: aminotransferase class IV [Tissierellaceae bacterium]
MKTEALNEYYMVNGQVRSTKDREIFTMIEKPPIYEVIRVINGVPLFLEEHLERMYNTANLIDYDLGRNEGEIREDIRSLILKNQIKGENIKLLSAELEGTGKVFLVYNSETFYPPKDYYENGIHTSLYSYQRDNPNAKVQFASFKEGVARAMEENKAFEVLLVNEEGYIPEGSRSNMFFLKGQSLYTAPASEVLIGITRGHIFDVCNSLGLKIVEETIHQEDLEKLNGAFMTGTSVNVLPITSIDHIEINSVNNPIIREINRAYISKMEKYVADNKSKWI